MIDLSDLINAAVSLYLTIDSAACLIDGCHWWTKYINILRISDGQNTSEFLDVHTFSVLNFEGIKIFSITN